MYVGSAYFIKISSNVVPGPIVALKDIAMERNKHNWCLKFNNTEIKSFNSKL